MRCHRKQAESKKQNDGEPTEVERSGDRTAAKDAVPRADLNLAVVGHMLGLDIEVALESLDDIAEGRSLLCSIRTKYQIDENDEAKPKKQDV